MRDIHDTTVSRNVQLAAQKLLPYTALGTTAPVGLINEVVILLAHCRKFAELQEHELAMHRHGEALKAVRTAMDTEAVVSLDQLIRDPKGATVGKVVKVDFDKGKKP